MSDIPLRVECTDCHFTTVVDPDDEELPSDVIVEHGRETGHKLTLSDQDPKRDHLTP